VPGVAVKRLVAAIAAALLFALGVVAALAEPPPTTTTGETTTTTATVPTTTTPVTTTAVTTTTQPAPTTTSPPTTSTAARPTSSPTSALPATQSCPLGGVIVLPPNGPASVVGPIADAHARAARIDGLAYAVDASIVSASSVELREGACRDGRLTAGTAELRDVSLFGGAATAADVTLELGNTPAASVGGLVVDGKAATAGTRIALQSWAFVVADAREPIPLRAGGAAFAALTVHILQAHAGLPAGTLILIGAAALQPHGATSAHARAAARHRKKQRGATHQPLTVTPPLGQPHYIFPVVGASDYIDTNGAFPPLGAPVVAVASGTINRVGWEKLGGWRLWVRDSVGDEFYYAHLSGYAPSDLHSNQVRAGEVIGFIGNTGDAFTTSPHLHFEIHPRSLLHLGYDGAVDPTTYLNGWTHLEHVDAPIPIHPPLPTQPLIRKEATYVFRELLAARHLVKHAPSVRQRPRVPIPTGANGIRIAAPAPPSDVLRVTRRTGDSSVMITLIVCLGFLGLFALWMFQAPLRRRLARRTTEQ
jgi:murein DD-endopeptidase MepM/ murein hydrolase activator NlpD